MSISLWSCEEDEILKSKYGKYTYEDLTMFLPKYNWYAIRYRARTLGLTGSSNLGRKYSTNKEFFSIPSVLNCYWGGFLAADGNVCNNRLTLKLAITDKEHLKRYMSDLEYNGKLYVYGGECSVQIKCPNYISDLEKNFNIVPRKSLILKPPNIIEDDLVLSYIVGLIDGDGSIHIRRQNSIVIVIYGTRFILEWIKFYVDKWASINYYTRSKVGDCQDGRKLSYYHFSGERAMKIYKRVLKLDIPKLDRKWSKFNKC